MGYLWDRFVANLIASHKGKSYRKRNKGRIAQMRSFLFMPFLCIVSSPAFASETITYTYDEQGRLVTVVHSGTVNNGQQVQYSYDQADNRVNVTVTGASH